MDLMYELNGYDPISGCRVFSKDVPQWQAAGIKSLVPVVDQGDGFGSVHLTRHQAEEIARLMESGMDLDGYEFYLEPFVAD